MQFSAIFAMKGEPLSSQCNKKGHRIDGRNAYDLQTRANRVRSNARPLRSANRRDARSSAGDVRPREAATESADGRHSQLQRRSLAHGMASPRFDVAQTRESSVELVRLLERTIKESRAVDTESLCVVAGAKVWAIRVDVRALNDDGNLCDCCALGAMATLAHFRRPDASDDCVTV